jgi:hypothetical protein
METYRDASHAIWAKKLQQWQLGKKKPKGSFFPKEKDSGMNKISKPKENRPSLEEIYAG